MGDPSESCYNGDISRINGHSLHGNTNVKTTNSLANQIAVETEQLLRSVLDLVIPFLNKADNERQSHRDNQAISPSSLVDAKSPQELTEILRQNGTLTLPDQGTSQDGLVQSLKSLLAYSVNTSAPGFLDKLYGAPLPPGIAAELILGVLNTNLHVYQVSPVLTLMETHVTRALAALFGFTGPRAGGINVQGGSASNTTSIVIARNTLFPRTKAYGNSVDGLDLVLFTSEHGHYSITKAAQQCGFGSDAVISIPVDEVTGRIVPTKFEELIVQQKQLGKTPFYVNATAGTTVLGSFDPFDQIVQIARKYGIWVHVDGAWGGSVVFSKTLRDQKLRGIEGADSIATNPHKMLGVPVTCSFLLLSDLRKAERACTLRAGYLFHDVDDSEPEDEEVNAEAHSWDNDDEEWVQPVDLADLTLQCGRRGDSLKFFLSWQYYGTLGYASKVETAYSVASHMANLVSQRENLVLVSENPPPCLQVCFYYAPGGKFLHQLPIDRVATEEDRARIGKKNSVVTSRITKALISRGYMTDFAPALGHEVEKGAFFRVVVNISTIKETVERLVTEVEDIGSTVVKDLKQRRG
ncbi:hypothetical protein PV10_00260 [Exophiala mesophila]|uniref:Glutamate decarboxylase n=1 Tax=Exophiala mesophila TaxID=212818 RepID=A0A0D1ZQY3_EXOME|nr:uncharacterized protein PV10_00260 [Exophiala mesophila]KIV96379.1 hypothetical protein PV10_00260 [Exophiala mesophila]